MLQFIQQYRAKGLIMCPRLLSFILFTLISIAYTRDWGYHTDITPSIDQFTILYKNDSKRLIGNKPSIQLNFNNASNAKFKNTNHTLVQLYLHTPFNPHIKELSLPPETHLFDKDNPKRLPMLTVLFKERKEKFLLEHITQNIPNKINEPKALTELNITDLILNRHGYHTFSGWLMESYGDDILVLKTPLQASKKRLKK